MVVEYFLCARHCAGSFTFRCGYDSVSSVLIERVNGLVPI